MYMIKDDKKINCLYYLSLIAITVLAALTIYPGSNWGGDFSQYIAQAYAIINGNIDEWFSMNKFIIENSPDGLGSTVYPWGFSLLIIPILKIFGTNYIALKIYILAFFVLSLIVIKKIFETKMTKLNAVFGMLCIGLCGDYISKLQDIGSDIPCLLFSVLAIYYINKRYTEIRKNWLWNILAGVAIYIAYLQRTMALGLILALFATDFIFGILILIKKKVILEKNKIYFELKYCAIPYVIWIVGYILTGKVLIKAGESYQTYFDFNLRFILSNSKYYLEQYVEMLSLLLIFISFVLIGILKNILRDIYYILYISGMTFMLCLYKFCQDPRFLMSIYPFVIMFMMIGIEHFIRSNDVYRSIYYMLAVILLLTFVWIIMSTVVPLRTGKCNKAYSTEANEVYAWINDNIEDDAVIAFFKPRVLYFNTDNYSYIPNESKRSIFDSDYILFAEGDDIHRFWDEVNDKCELIFTNNQFDLYRVGKEK